MVKLIMYALTGFSLLIFCPATKTIDQVNQISSGLSLTISLEEEKESLLLALKNQGSYEIYLPSDFTVDSNFFPNGLESYQCGSRISLSYTHVSNWASHHIEGIVLCPPKGFDKIEPNSSIYYSIDIRNHINEYLERDDLGIDLSDTLTVSVEFSNRWDHSDDRKTAWKGSVKSNKIKFLYFPPKEMVNR